MKIASPKSIIAAKNFFEANPNGTIPTGIWTDPTWTKDQFFAWFRRCLHLKTGGRELTEKDQDLRADYRRVQDYKQHRVLSHGRNLMRSKLFARLYPYLHNPTID